jgi:hypothetical protein
MAWGPYTKAKRLVEDAAMRGLMAHADGELAHVTAYTGRSRAELVTPRVFVVAVDAEPYFADDGTLLWWEVKLAMGVTTHMHDWTQEQHDAISAVVQDYVMRQDHAETFAADPDAGIALQQGVAGWEVGQCSESDGPEITEAAQVTVRCIIT